MLHHSPGPECPSCENKLQQAQPALADWFRMRIKPNFPDAHISWSFRDEENQNECFANGSSHAPWPKSPHNYAENDVPRSKALDLFQLTHDNKALFPPSFYRDITALTEASGDPIKCGLKNPELGDHDHFELVLPKSP